MSDEPLGSCLPYRKYMSSNCTFSAIFALQVLTIITCAPLLGTLHLDPQCSIPHNELARVQELLDNYFQDSSKTINISCLTGGYSQENALNLLVTAEKHQYVLRMYPATKNPADMQREMYVAKQAEKVGLFPRIYFAAPDGSAILRDYIVGKTLLVEIAKQNCIKMAESLRKTHAIAKNPYPHSQLNIKDYMEDMYTSICHWDANDNDAYEAISLIRKQFDVLESMHFPKTTTHGDLISRNILSSDDVLFIDWEHTRWEDPFHDVAFVVLFCALDAEEERILLEAYLQHSPTSQDRQHYAIVKKIHAARLHLIFAYRYAWLQFTAIKKQPIDLAAEMRPWLYYMQQFARNDEELSVQFFYDASKAAIQLARNLND